MSITAVSPNRRGGAGRAAHAGIKFADGQRAAARMIEEPTVTFGLLGPLRVRRGHQEYMIAGARQRILLAGMVARAGHAIPQDELAELVWDGEPPAAAHVTLRSYIARLRRTLGPEAGSRLVTRNPGYLIDAHEAEVDHLRFARLCRDGAASIRSASWQRASDQLTEALALWRGTPLADVPCQALRQSEVPRLEELRMQALEQRLSADLNLGRHFEIIAELRQLAAAHPLREGLQGLLMLGLYRAGRQADALLAYGQTRNTLVRELGIEPCVLLRGIHRQILDHDPALEAVDFTGLTAAVPQSPGIQPHASPRLTQRRKHPSGNSGIDVSRDRRAS
jgi:DNA-binding SARP family transcriptional activator